MKRVSKDRINRFLTTALLLSGIALGSAPEANAATGTEGFPASAPGGITSSLFSITEGGAAITRTSPSACFASWQSYSGFTGLALHLYGVRNDITFTFSSSEIVTSFSFQAQAVNGVQSGRVNYANNTTTSFSIPSTVSLQTVAFAGNGNRITSFSIVGITGSGCNGDGSASSGNDYWILDNISWTYSAVVSDTTPPTFPSAETFSTPENSTAVGTIVASESSTITLFGGDDLSKFSLLRSSDSSAALSFVTAPNFEAPTDTGANNTYVVVLKAVDAASNAGYETVTVTVTDVNDTASISTFGLAANATTANFKTATNITINVSVASRITFLSNGKRIAGCIKKATSGTSPNITVTCSWSPSTRGSVSLTAVIVPVDQNIAGLTSTPVNIRVGNRSGNR
jgi:hypothetical protein